MSGFADTVAIILGLAGLAGPHLVAGAQHAKGAFGRGVAGSKQRGHAAGRAILTRAGLGDAPRFQRGNARFEGCDAVRHRFQRLPHGQLVEEFQDV